MPAENLTLYAVWEADTYTLTYNANGGSGAPSAQSITINSEVTISSTVPTRSNYLFAGWATSSSATEPKYSKGQSNAFTITGNTTLYAVWYHQGTASGAHNVYKTNECKYVATDLRGTVTGATVYWTGNSNVNSGGGETRKRWNCLRNCVFDECYA